MKRMRKCWGMVGFVVTAIALAAPTVSADDDRFICAGTLPPGTYDTVIVPAGGACAADPGAIEIGKSLKVSKNGKFTSTPDTLLTVLGNVEGRQGSIIDIQGPDEDPLVDAIEGHVHSHKGDLILAFIDIGGNVEGVGGSRVIVRHSTLTRGSILADNISGLGSTTFLEINYLFRGDIRVKNNDLSCVPAAADPAVFPECFAGDYALNVEGNTLEKGGIDVHNNGVVAPDTPVNVWDNNVVARHIEVLKTTGNGDRNVNGNTVGGHLLCLKNEGNVIGGPNDASRFPNPHNQCSAEEPE